MGLPRDFTELANTRFEESKNFWRNWRSEARDDFAFVAGKQWMEEDEMLLKAQKRPPITFNYSEKMIDAVVGAEVSNRQEVTYLPRDVTDAGLAELWTNAAKWARDEGDHGDEETDAFRDTLICGLGWTYTSLSYEVEPDGMIECGRVDPLEMFPDPSATKSGLKDRRYNTRMWWVDERVAKKRWPDAVSFKTYDEAAGIDFTSRNAAYNDEQDADELTMHKGQIQIRHYECVELEPYYRVATDKSIIEVAPADFGDIKEALDEAGIPYVKQDKRVYYYGFFAGDTLVESGKSPCQEGFCYQCITGKRDRNKATWYGLTRVMKDPQRWANKWLSQILHIINSNSKGGIFAEVNAFIDPKKAQDDYAKPDQIVFLKEGAVSGKKITEKGMVNYPTGLDRLMEFALNSLPQVTGINLEALGLAGREQANVLEQSRKQAAYGLLAPVFDSLRHYRKSQGRILLHFIHEYISDGRLIRIGGPDSQNFIQLTKAPNAPRYDIIVDQSPTAPDVKQKTWQTLENILPAMMKAGIPLPPDILDYLPIPTAMAMKWKQFMMQNPQMDPEQAKKITQENEQLTQENQKLEMKLQDKQQEMQLEIQKAEQELKLEQIKIKMKYELDVAKLKGEMQIKQMQAQNDMQLAQQKNDADIAAQEQLVAQQGQNEHQNNVMKSINDLLGVVGKLENDSNKDD